MIPLDTKPGTEIVCIDASNRKSKSFLVEGEIYTLAEWVIGFSPSGEIGYGVRVAELPQAYGLRRHGHIRDRFRLLELSGLDELLKEEVPKELEVAS